MPIECSNCQTRTRVVYFRSYKHYPRQVRNLWWLVLAMAAISTYNAVAFLVDLVPFSVAADALHDDIQGELPDNDFGQAVGDAEQFIVNVLDYLITLAVVAMFYFPIRYGIVLKRFRKGHPRTFWSIRSTAWLTIFIALFIWMSLVVLFSDLKYFHVSASLGFNVLVAPIILLQLRRRDVREYFSQFKWEALPPVEPTAATFLPSEARPEPEQVGWRRLD